MSKLMGDKNLLTNEDILETYHDRSEIIAQDLEKYLREKYAAKDGAAVVSLALLIVSVGLTKDFKQIPKEAYMDKVSHLWDNLIVHKV